MNYNLITILGPTATGKTSFAAHLAFEIDGEVISADSRQVYRQMDIGTGKDLNDYLVHGEKIPHHLIDIVDPGYEYNVYEFQQDFLNVFDPIHNRGKMPVLCGGTGLYLEAVLKGYRLSKVPENPELRAEVSTLKDEELVDELKQYRPLHNTTDTNDRNRLIRALEIARYELDHQGETGDFPDIRSLTLGISFERKRVRERITARLKSRLDEGMIEEVQGLLQSGIEPETLEFYGLEYRYITQYLTGVISYNTMFEKLNTAIHQFAKRQMTWFRRMERRGFNIHWIDGEKCMNEKVDEAMKLIGEASG
ncbi:MAG: tRNA (adenosine(37)-N6)-dimethylallyltransferase MiaA [Bacteroidales bacterium]|nr:tRNA (adenosine(37)-N6)-dimethylallyltransferase MiaA [Bacteroidales bacterium]